MSASSSSSVKRRKLEAEDPQQQLRDGLLDILSQVGQKKVSEFAVGGIIEQLPPSPGIEIAGYGMVSLPVTKVTVKDLRKHFMQAPYGLGEETLIDKAVRDSWQLDPEKFKVKNPKFNAGINKLVEEIQGDLGCSKLKVTSHLYKLLLYEPGGHFKPHRDTEKHPGMFATLIIQVPSLFTGGDLVIRHGTREKTIAFSTPQSEFSCMFAAHFADCEHKLTEITSGYRMALVYSLCWDGNGVVPSPPDVPTNKLAGLLEQIGQVLPDPHMIAWGLDHHYSQNSFLQKGIQALKGGDKLIYSTLQGANALLEDDKKLDFLFVEAKKLDNLYGECTMDHEDDYWGYDEEDEDEEEDEIPVITGGRTWVHKDECPADCFEEAGCETEYKYKVIGPDGKPWDGSRNFKLDVSRDILNVGRDDDEFWGKCHEGECSGPSGNEGATKTNWYRRYVLVIFPKVNVIRVVYKDGLESGIDYLEQQLSTSKDASVGKLANDIVSLCEENKKRFCRCEKSVITMLKVILRMKKLELAKRILPLLSEPLVSYWSGGMYSWNSQKSKGTFGIPSEEMISVLKDLITAFTWQQLSDPLTELIETCPPQHYKHAVAFLEKCPDDVPKEKLLASLVEKNLSEAEDRVTDESLVAFGGVILSYPRSCSQYIQPFLDLPKLQNLKMLTNLLPLIEKQMGKETRKNRACEMTLAKFSEQLHQLFRSGSTTSASDVDAIVKGAEFLDRMEETTLLEKLVEDVLQNPSPQLLQKLLASSLGQSASVSEPFKRLIVARVNQLLPVVQAGEPKFDWCQPTAVIPDHPEVQAFLRGPERKFVYHGFNGKGQATKFERDYFRGRGNAVVNVIGSRSNTVVEITKIPASGRHEEAMRRFDASREELKRLQAKLA